MEDRIIETPSGTFVLSNRDDVQRVHLERGGDAPVRVLAELCDANGASYNVHLFERGGCTATQLLELMDQHGSLAEVVVARSAETRDADAWAWPVEVDRGRPLQIVIGRELTAGQPIESPTRVARAPISGQ